MLGECVLVRHAVPSRPEAGGPDDHHRGLTPRGRRQAEELVAELPRPTLVVSSPYLRAVRTVEPLARAYGMAVRVEHDLREWDSGLGPTPDFARHYAASWPSVPPVEDDPSADCDPAPSASHLPPACGPVPGRSARARSLDRKVRAVVGSARAGPQRTQG